jgi:hypothetical protein
MKLATLFLLVGLTTSNSFSSDYFQLNQKDLTSLKIKNFEFYINGTKAAHCNQESKNFRQKKFLFKKYDCKTHSQHSKRLAPTEIAFEQFSYGHSSAFGSLHIPFKHEIMLEIGKYEDRIRILEVPLWCQKPIIETSVLNQLRSFFSVESPERLETAELVCEFGNWNDETYYHGNIHFEATYSN